MRITVIGRLAVAAALAVGLAAVPSPARADAVPFSDPNAHGGIGLCDKAGNQITSGRIGDHPFAGRAVSSAPAPAGYGADQRGKATLFAYQPRYGVDPGDWSGQQMTGSSLFSNDRSPMAEGTVLDPSVGDFVSAFPAKWEGLVQLRMTFGAPDKPGVLEPYPAAVLRVQGDRWTLVQSAKVDCKAGRVLSMEKVILPKSKFKTTPPAAPSGSGSATSRGDASAGRSAAARGAGPSGAGAAPSPSTVDLAGAHATAAKTRGGSGGAVVWWVIGAVIVAGMGASLWLRRRRPSV